MPDDCLKSMKLEIALNVGYFLTVYLSVIYVYHLYIFYIYLTIFSCIIIYYIILYIIIFIYIYYLYIFIIYICDLIQRKMNKLELRQDFADFCRWMCTKWFFTNEPTPQFSRVPAFSPKSSWKPPKGHPQPGGIFK